MERTRVGSFARRSWNLSPNNIAVLISSGIEWRVVRRLFPNAEFCPYPFGEWFTTEFAVGGQNRPVSIFHGGWGKISAAASTQYVVDHWSPTLLVNLGTCGGFEGEIERGTVVLADRTLVYDIVEQMTDFDESIRHYSTTLDLSWLQGETPHPVLRTLLVSADRDLIAEQVPELKQRYAAVAGDWESGAIAWVAARNNVRCLILRGVTDLVGSHGGEAYEGNLGVFERGAEQVLSQLFQHLPKWLELALQ